jgi:hypothetical protein
MMTAALLVHRTRTPTTGQIQTALLGVRSAAVAVDNLTSWLATPPTAAAAPLLHNAAARYASQTAFSIMGLGLGHEDSINHQCGQVTDGQLLVPAYS